MSTNNNISDAAISEVGSGSLPNMPNDPWQVLMEMQNKNLIELVKALKSAPSETTNNKTVVLPKFNADLVGADASAWCATVNHPYYGIRRMVAEGVILDPTVFGIIINVG